MVRRVDPNGEAQVWCRKCSGYGRCRLEPTLMIRCRPAKIDTKEHAVVDVFGKVTDSAHGQA